MMINRETLRRHDLCHDPLLAMMREPHSIAVTSRLSQTGTAFSFLEKRGVSVPFAICKFAANNDHEDILIAGAG